MNRVDRIRGQGDSGEKDSGKTKNAKYFFFQPPKIPFSDMDAKLEKLPQNVEMKKMIGKRHVGSQRIERL